MDIYPLDFIPKNMFKLTLIAVIATLVPFINAVKVGAITKHDLQRMEKEQHQLDDEVRAFQKNLEGLKTTIEFAPVSV